LQIQENKKKPSTQNRFQRKMKEMMDKAEEQRKLQNRK
jgi:YidC/Oxa1 family membrane protein insertase